MVRKQKKLEHLATMMNINKRYEILRGEYKSSLKSDEKLFWWLLGSDTDKLVIIFVVILILIDKLMLRA